MSINPLTKGGKRQTEREGERALNDHSGKALIEFTAIPSRIISHQQKSVQQDRPEEKMEQTHSFPMSSLFSHVFL